MEDQPGEIEKPTCPVAGKTSSRRPHASSPPVDVPALPKLRGKCTLVTTKLCETKLKSTTGLFDLSFPQDSGSFSSEYNSLHDPYLKGYYYNNEAMRTKLIKSQFVTEDLYVRCSLKEYNEYRRFLENEFMKVHKREEDDAMSRHIARMQPRQKTEAEWEREEWRKNFFASQKRRLLSRQRKMRRLENEEAAFRQRKEQQRLLRKEQFEIQREAEREHRMLLHLKKELAEESKKKKLMRRTSDLERQRIIHLQEQKQQERLKHAEEMEQKWQRWEEHSARAKEEEEERKLKAERDRQKRMEKREKIFRILQRQDEERRRKAAEQNHQQAEQLKEQADMIEQTLKQKKEKEVQEWKSDFQKRKSAWEEKICSYQRCGGDSSTSVHTKSSMSRASLVSSRVSRRVRINSQPEIIPLFAGSTKTGRNGVSSSGPTEKEVFLDEDIIVEDEVDLDCEEDHKEKDKEEFAMKQKAEEMVCTVLSKAIKAFL